MGIRCIHWSTLVCAGDTSLTPYGEVIEIYSSNMHHFAVAGPDCLCSRSCGIWRFLRTVTGSHWRRFYLCSTTVFSVLEVFFTRMCYINPHLTLTLKASHDWNSSLNICQVLSCTADLSVTVSFLWFCSTMLHCSWEKIIKYISLCCSHDQFQICRLQSKLIHTIVTMYIQYSS